MWFITDGIISTWFIINAIFFLLGSILGFIAYKWVNNEQGFALIFFCFIFIMCSIISEILRIAIKYNF